MKNNDTDKCSTEFKTVDPPPNLDLKSTEFLPGQLIADRYRVLSVIGRGGMGVVYKVEQIYLNQLLALKTLYPEHANSVASQRFQKEAMSAGALRHDNLVRIFDCGMLAANQPFLAMELVEGETLAEYLKKNGPMPIAMARRIFVQAASAMHYAHEQGIVHRDLKPSNIMLAATGKTGEFDAKIVDFGIAKVIDLSHAETRALTSTGEILGTPFYMSPEQCLAEATDARSDQYSLACSLFETLTGTPPFCAESPLTTLMQHRSEKPPSLKEASLGKNFPAHLESLINKALQKDPRHRFASMQDFADDLASEQTKPMHEEVGATPSSPPASRTTDVKSVALLAIAGLAILVIGIVGGMHFSPLDDSHAPTTTVPKALSTELEVMKQEADIIQVDKEFSHFETGERNAKVRVFEFPAKPALGAISLIDKRHITGAQGHMQFPASAKIWFSPSWNLCVQPDLFKWFKPGDISVLSFARNENCSDETMAHITHLKLDALDLEKTEVSDKVLPYVDKIGTLKSLTVYGCNLTGKELAKLKTLPQLERLNAGALADHDCAPIVNTLQQNKHIKQLSLSHNGLTDADLKGISQLKSLETLWIGDSQLITPSGLGQLAALPKLITLSMAEMDTMKFLPQLKRMKSLHHITVSRDDVAIDAIHKLLPNCSVHGEE